MATTNDSSINDVEVVSKPVKINTFSLMMIGFFLTSGGIYGNEEIITVASPNIALAALLITSVLYGLPLMLITAELASVLPEAGGNIAWVKEAFGPAVGHHNAYWVWISYTLDASLYPRFAASYLSKALRISSINVISDTVIIVVTMIKLIGTRSAVKLNIMLSLMSIIPSLLFLGIAIKDLKVSPLIEKNGETNWDELITWVLWLYSGTFGMGCVAKEVENPGRSYFITCIVLLSLDVILINFLPLWLSLSIDPNREHYASGHFAQLGQQLTAGWLGVMLVMGAQVSQIGLYNSCSIAADRYLAGVLRNTFSSFMQLDDGARGRFTSQRKPSRLYQKLRVFFLDDTSTGAPRIAILLNCVIHFFVAWLPITSTLSLAMVVISLVIVLFGFAYLKLRFYRPDLERKYAVPGGVFGAFAWALSCIGLSIVNIVLGLASGGMSAKVVFLGVVVGTGFFIHGVCYGYQRLQQARSTNPQSQELASMKVMMRAISKSAKVTSPDHTGDFTDSDTVALSRSCHVDV